jgi:putative membrane protein
MERIMKRNLTSILVAGLLMPVAATLMGAEQRGQLSEKDFKFVRDAARGGAMEVQLGQLAAQKAENQAVKDFGQRMVTDHGKANSELRRIAESKGAMLPAEMTHHENSNMEKFEKLSGREFDKEYAEHMVKDHKKDVKEFQDASKDLTDPDLKAFAEKTLPTLQDHLRSAQDVEASVKK